MKKNKLLIYLFLIASALLFFLGQESVALAVGASTAAEEGLDAAASVANLTSKTEAIELAGNIVRTVLGFLGLIFIILVLYAGFVRMTAQGDAAKVKHSTDLIKSAIIGLIIIFASYILTLFVIRAISGSIAGSEGDSATRGTCAEINGSCYPLADCPAGTASFGVKNCQTGQACCAPPI
ncbi:MAG: hypothetical protein PHT40_04680 [Patescibacteria group bacterium]|nr:hypothetical protein [Patescibacteria group bacterium]